MKTAQRHLLRVLRAAHEPRLSQRQIALLTGMTRIRYWQIENCDGPMPSQDEQDAICDALGVKASQVAWPEREDAFDTERAS